MVRPRLYDAILEDHLARHRQMAFVSGPRQVGKTTTCRKHATTCLDWDDVDHRRTILAGPNAIAEAAGLARLRASPPVLVSVDTARRWVETLVALDHGFLVRPWFKNVAKALRKAPKWFLRDWSGIEEEGSRAETACHLQKAVDGWTDLGFGEFELRYLRDKEKREVDFLVVRDRKPWCLVEVKKSDDRPSPHLVHFQRATSARHAFQVVFDLDYVDADSFERRDPTVVPARSFLSQLL